MENAVNDILAPGAASAHTPNSTRRPEHDPLQPDEVRTGDAHVEVTQCSTILNRRAPEEVGH